LAPERTVLATQRSALAMTALAALMVRVGIERSIWIVAGPMTAILAVAAIATWFRGLGAYHRRVDGEHMPPRSADLRFLAATTGLAGVAAFVLALLA
jgi:hypothetical protein